MNDEFTRDNRIKKLDLQIKMLGVHLTSIAIIFAICTFVIGSSQYSQPEKCGISAFLMFVVIILLWSLATKNSEIDDIFRPYMKKSDETIQRVKKPIQISLLKRPFVRYISLFVVSGIIMYLGLCATNYFEETILNLEYLRSTLVAIGGGVFGAMCYSSLQAVFSNEK